MGRPRKSISVLKKNGTYRKSRHKYLEKSLKAETVKDISKPKMPLNERARREYYRLCGELKKLNILSDIDLSLVEMAAHYYGVFFDDYEYVVKKYGSMPNYLDQTSTQKAMLYNSMNSAYKNYIEIGMRFGITPMARLNIKSPPEKGENDFEKFMLKVVK